MSRFLGYTRQEPSMRIELGHTLRGSSVEMAKGYRVLIRRMRRDDKSRLLPCTCNIRGEGQNNPGCVICLGEGYLWDESWATVFKYDLGSPTSVKGLRTRFYFEHDTVLTKQDRIVEVTLDDDGNLVAPYDRRILWAIAEIAEKRSDGGRLEYKIAYCDKKVMPYEHFVNE